MLVTKDVAQGTIFSSMYPEISARLLTAGKFQKSRYGDTKELLSYTVKLENPKYRCVGGYNRNINIFFLLAEAMWIWIGHNDVAFLEWFNSRMPEFSDNGHTFHAPYGFRLRNYGVKSGVDGAANINPIFGGLDQIAQVYEMLKENPDDRRATASIWNPFLDLRKKSKDIPCNDFVMFKIREGGLRLSVMNRSNDLHWGLPTNVFQFSFIGEMLAKALGVSFTHQTHFIDSLHFYIDNPIAERIHRKYIRDDGLELYSICNRPEIDIDFGKYARVSNNLQFIDNLMDITVAAVTYYRQTSEHHRELVGSIQRTSKYFTMVYRLLTIYLRYRFDMSNSDSESQKDFHRVEAIDCILKAVDDIDPSYINTDFVVLALNFFAARIKYQDNVPAVLSDYIGSL